ncbi:MAG TPA: CvpA family protein [Syntrophaceae bacterium]|nr:CvpA family protein [Syntrophaceae bacterium]
MNVLDIIIILILTLCIIRSLFRGFIKEIFSILGIIIGVLIASRYYYLLFPCLSRYVSNQDYINLFSFTLVFLSVFLIVMLLGILLKALLKVMFIGWVDHTLGGVFGLLKGVIYVALLVWVLTTFLPKGSGLMEKSRLSPYITHISKTFVVMVPPKLECIFNEKQQVLKELWYGKAQKTRRKNEN